MKQTTYVSVNTSPAKMWLRISCSSLFLFNYVAAPNQKCLAITDISLTLLIKFGVRCSQAAEVKCFEDLFTSIFLKKYKFVAISVSNRPNYTRRWYIHFRFHIRVYLLWLKIIWSTVKLYSNSVFLLWIITISSFTIRLSV